MSTATRPSRTYGKRHSTKRTSSSKPIPNPNSAVIEPPPSTPQSGSARRMKKRRTTSDVDDDELSWLQKRRKPSGDSRSQEDTESAASSLGGARGKPNGKSATRFSNPNILPTSVHHALALPEGETQRSLPSTPKKPKNLSSIFDAVTPNSSSRSPSRLNIGSPSTPGRAGRMLGRSRTESSIEDSPSRKSGPPRKTKSFVETSLTDLHLANTSSGSSHTPLKRTASQLSEKSHSESQSEFRRPGVKASRTYAGASRSFLVSIPASTTGASINGEDALDGSQNDDDLGTYRASYTELRKRYGIDISSDNPNTDDKDERLDEGLSLYNPLSSITDLRSKGESRRFTDEVGYLLEGLDATAELSVRRSSASDIVQKLCDSAYWRKARAAGLLSKIWELMRGAGAGDGDKVLDYIICCYIALASEDSRDILNLASHDDFVETISELLGTYQDKVTSSVKIKATKIEQLTFDRMRECLLGKEGIVPDGCSPSVPFLLSKALAVAPELIFSNIHKVIDSMSTTLSEITGHWPALLEGLPIAADDFEKMAHQGSLGHVRNCLEIFDAYLLRVRSDVVEFGPSKKGIQSRHLNLAGDLLSLVSMVESTMLDLCSDFVKAQFNDCVDLSFRILINLTDGSRAWSEAALSKPSALPAIVRAAATSQAAVMSQSHSMKKVPSDEDKEQVAKTMDRLCLALALLTNLLQELDTLALSMQDIFFSATCTNKVVCLNGCQCDSAITSTAAIVSMYNIALVKKDEDELTPDLLFLRGHLALLVALFLLQLKNADSDPDATHFHDILADLSGTTYRRKLDALVKNVETFSRMYSSVASSVSQQVDTVTTMDIEHDVGDDDESEKVSNGRDEAQLDVVRLVLLSLQTLRDEL